MGFYNFYKRISSRKNREKSFPFSSWEPSSEFVDRARAQFLTEFRNIFVTRRPLTPIRTAYFASGFAAGMALAILVSASAVYADKQDVAPSSMLYPLKRAHESFVLAFSEDRERPILYLNFAGRRLNELEEIKRLNPQSSIIKRLRAELAQAVNNSLPTLEEEPVNEDLKTISSVLQTPSPAMLEMDEDNTGKSHLKEKKEERDGIEQEANSTFKTQAASSTVYPSADDAVIFKKQLEKEGKGGRRGESSAEKFEAVTVQKAKGEKLIERDGRRLEVCASWELLFRSDIPEVQQVLQTHAAVLRKFEKHCR